MLAVPSILLGNALIILLDQLDARSLADQRALTVPFVKQVLGL